MKDLKEDNQLKEQEKMIKERRSDGYKKFRWDGGQTTQFVVGAAEHETDLELLKRIDWGYKKIDLRRAYFSSFIPIEGTPFGSKQAAPLEREHRLYQSDWLMRIYHFKLKDLEGVVTEEGNLPKGDPKIHLAREYFKQHKRVNPNEASYQELLRVPGIGPISAKRIINLRAKKFVIKRRQDLRAVGVVLKRADPYILIDGRTQTTLHHFSNEDYNQTQIKEIY